MSTGAAPRRLFPLPLGGQAVAINSWLDERGSLPGLIDGRESRIGVINRRGSFHFRARVAPLHGVEPTYGLHRMRGGLERADIVERIAMRIRISLLNEVPIAARDQRAVHVEGAHED